jgi:hypothetical protein
MFGYTASPSVWAREEPGGGTWAGISVDADPTYQTILIAAEKASRQSVKTGEPPALFALLREPAASACQLPRFSCDFVVGKTKGCFALIFR